MFTVGQKEMTCLLGDALHALRRHGTVEKHCAIINPNSIHPGKAYRLM